MTEIAIRDALQDLADPGHTLGDYLVIARTHAPNDDECLTVIYPFGGLPKSSVDDLLQSAASFDHSPADRAYKGDYA